MSIDPTLFLAHLTAFMTEDGRVHGDHLTFVDARIGPGAEITVLYRERPSGPVLGWRHDASYAVANFGSDRDERQLAWDVFSNEIADPTGDADIWLTDSDAATGLSVTWVGVPRAPR